MLWATKQQYMETKRRKFVQFSLDCGFRVMRHYVTDWRRYNRANAMERNVIIQKCRYKYYHAEEKLILKQLHIIRNFESRQYYETVKNTEKYQ